MSWVIWVDNKQTPAFCRMPPRTGFVGCLQPRAFCRMPPRFAILLQMPAFWRMPHCFAILLQTPAFCRSCDVCFPKRPIIRRMASCRSFPPLLRFLPDNVFFPSRKIRLPVCCGASLWRVPFQILPGNTFRNTFRRQTAWHGGIFPGKRQLPLNSRLGRVPDDAISNALRGRSDKIRGCFR